MLKKYISTITIVCMLVCILPIKSNAMDKENFMKFLVNSAYPEASKNQNTEEETSTTDKESSGESEVSTKSESSDYIKVHVGEENIPDIATSADSNKSKSEYNNDIRVTKENPRILIYHTHGCETYSNSPAGNYHSKDQKNSVMEVGRMLTDELNNKGWGVLHTTKYHDYPSYNHSYANSLQTIQGLVNQYNSIDLAIDLHRDAKNTKDDKSKQLNHNVGTTTIDGKKVAKFSLVIGGKNENVAHLREVTQGITNIAQKKYPGLSSGVIEKDYAKFNQFVAKNNILIEIGSNATSVDEAKATTKYVAEILDEYFRTNK